MDRARIYWGRLAIVLVVGGTLATICFALGWWWGGTIFALLTLFGACFSFSARLRPVVLTLFAVFAIAWLTGSLLDQFLPVEGAGDTGWRIALAVLSGIAAGVGLPALFWFLVFLVSTEWLVSVSASQGVSKAEALRFVAARTFGTAQGVFVVENGKLVVERPRGILSKLGGPGVLIVGPGNAVVLERGLQITRVLGAGTYKLLPGENFKQPLETKGIIDLRVQFIAVMVENALTRDGFSLAIKMRAAAQVEPASVTAKRPPSSHGRGKVTSIILGAPEYPVHRTTLLKVAYSTPDRGWRELLDQGSVAFLRDTVATYNVGDIIVLTTPHRADQDQPIISQIETKVKNRLNSILSTAGIWVENLDLEVSPPEEVSELMRKRWRARIERQLKIEETDEAEQEITSRRGGEQAQLITQEAGRAQKETAPSRIALVRLWRTLETRFDEGEFRGLCFGLNVGYDVLPGDGLANKARELVQYLERRDRTFELVEMGNELRPDIPWLDIFHGQAD